MRVARGGSRPDTTRNNPQNKSSMEPPRSPQEPPLYVSPQSREEQQLVKELQTITGLEAHVAQRQLRYHEWELQPALAHYLDKGAVSAATSGASPGTPTKGRTARCTTSGGSARCAGAWSRPATVTCACWATDCSGSRSAQ